MEFEDSQRPRKQRRPRTRRTRHFECANCGERYVVETGGPSGSAFCSVKCRSTAKAVRYVRAKLREFGSRELFPDDIELAVKYKVGHALGEGYDSAARTIPKDTRDRVVSRDNAKCVHCGEDGQEIDHIEGNSNDLSNLRLLCRSCHRRVTNVHFQPITDEVTRRYRDKMLARIHSLEPLLFCDGTDWDFCWRAWVREHETTLRGGDECVSEPRN